MQCRHSMPRFDGPPTRATWGARCGKSARRVLRGGTGTSDIVARPVPTHHNVQHYLLLEKVARRVQDDDVMRLLKMILKATGKKGVPQGGVVSPLLSNLYLNEVDRMLEKAVETTRRGKYTSIQYARVAADMLILNDAERRRDWLVKAVNRRLRRPFAPRGV